MIIKKPKRLKINLVYQGYNHQVSKCLDEALDLIYFSLQDLGHDVERVMNPHRLDKHEPDLYIINGWHFSDEWTQLPPHKTIIVQLENLVTGALANKFAPEIFDGYHVWDYSKTNKKAFKKSTLASYNVIEWGYHRCLDFFTPSKNPSNEVLFYGSLTPRRQTILTAIDSFNEVTCAYNQWGGKMDRLIEDSKAVVNIGAYKPLVKGTTEGRIIESLRLAYCVNNGVLVVSEDSECPEQNEYWNRYCDVVPLDEIAETIAENLFDDKYIDKRFAYSQLYKKETSMTKNMEKLLENTK
tara:strand:+ start:24 stop:914 length:891 start_codon:yes stop_codon:yes gene_type:complete